MTTYYLFLREFYDFLNLGSLFYRTNLILVNNFIFKNLFILYYLYYNKFILFIPIDFFCLHFNRFKMN